MKLSELERAADKKANIYVEWGFYITQLAGTKHRSQFYQIEYRKYPTHLYELNLSPNQKFLGLRLAFTSVWDTFCIGKTMTCDLCFVLVAQSFVLFSLIMLDLPEPNVFIGLFR